MQKEKKFPYKVQSSRQMMINMYKDTILKHILRHDKCKIYFT